jgi:hypothetical protein
MGTFLNEQSLQSNNNACPSLACTLTNWSIIPQGAPAYLCSAIWHKSVFFIKVNLIPVNSSKKVATETSKLADEESPPPSGTVVPITKSQPGNSLPVSLINNAQTPRT